MVAAGAPPVVGAVGRLAAGVAVIAARAREPLWQPELPLSGRKEPGFARSVSVSVPPLPESDTDHSVDEDQITLRAGLGGQLQATDPDRLRTLRGKLPSLAVSPRQVGGSSVSQKPRLQAGALKRQNRRKTTKPP